MVWVGGSQDGIDKELIAFGRTMTRTRNTFLPKLVTIISHTKMTMHETKITFKTISCLLSVGGEGGGERGVVKVVEVVSLRKRPRHKATKMNSLVS